MAKTSLVYPRPSPKMDVIYSALLEGWSDAEINSAYADTFILWGLIGDNANILKNKNSFFCDMPYFNRWMPGQSLENSNWRFIPSNIHNNTKLDVTIDRFESLNKKVSPWKTGGEHILICPSSDTVTNFIHGCSSAEWASRVKKTLSGLTMRPFKVRYKPRKGNTSGPAAANIQIEDDLENCHAVVVSGSLVAIDALLCGVPVFTTSPNHCPAAWVANTDLDKINKPYYYDREHLLANLAWKQFSIQEMRSGFCYEHLFRLYNNKRK